MHHLLMLMIILYTVSDDGVRGYWIGQWQAVNRANQVITNVPNIDMDTTLRTRLVASD